MPVKHIWAALQNGYPLNPVVNFLLVIHKSILLMHRLIADDNVIAKRIQDEIIGTSPDTIRHFMEIRGVGIIDVFSVKICYQVIYQLRCQLV